MISTKGSSEIASLEKRTLKSSSTTVRSDSKLVSFAVAPKSIRWKALVPCRGAS